jgi:hypothetical protein
MATDSATQLIAQDRVRREATRGLGREGVEKSRANIAIVFPENVARCEAARLQCLGKPSVFLFTPWR